jgi:multiple sugar transport system substrate-binding protein
VIDKHLAGTTLKFLMPPWGDMGAAEFAKFTDRTGITVQLETLPFDQVHDKAVAAMAAGTPPADVMEIDSLWVGQFAAAGWLTPITPYIDPTTLSTVAAKDPFTVKGQLLAMPWVVDFRWTVVNMTLLAKAGITTQPQSWADVKADAEAIKAKGILKYPISMPMNISAEATEPWLTLMVAGGGTVLDSSGKPTFADPNSAGYQAAAYLRSLYAAGLIDPASVNLAGQAALDQFAGGQSAFGLRDGPGLIAYETNPATSKVAKDNIVGFLSGPNGASSLGSGVFGLPEGLGIPANATNKDAAAMFIAWWNETPQEVFRYTQPAGSSFPAQGPAIDEVLATLASQGVGYGPQIKAVLPNIHPLFADGAPTWYPQFVNDAATTLQSVILGDTSVDSGMKKLADEVTALASK